MQKLITDLQARLQAFLAQRTNLLLVVRAGEAEYLPLVSVMAGIESESADDVLPFGDPFESPAAYATALINVLATRYTAIASELRKEREDLPAELPAELRQERRAPVDRLRDALVFERGLLADLEASRVVVGLFPSSIKDHAVYARFVMALVEHQLPQPWCHHMRFIVREDARQALLSQHARTLPRTEFYAPDFSPPALAKALEDQAYDENEKLPLRMNALLQCAALDYAHGRLPAAAEKYALLSRYHAALGPPVMLALSRNGMGEVLVRAGKPVEAQRAFEQALVPAIESKMATPIINIMLNLASLHRQQGRWRLAYEHYEAVSGLAKVQVNAMLQIRCLEQMGFCQHKLRDTQKAWEHWHAGAELARGVGAREELLDCLQRIRALYKEKGMSSDERQVASEASQLERDGVRVYPT